MRQTVTLLFDQPLAPGTYEIVLAPQIQAAVYNIDEAGLLAGDGSFAGHPVVTDRNGTVVNGGDLVVTGLVTPAGTPADPRSIAQGTPFLTQLQGDLGALLDDRLTQNGDDPTITAILNSQILARFAPAIAAAGGKSSIADVVPDRLVRSGVPQPPISPGPGGFLQPGDERSCEQSQPDVRLGRGKRRGRGVGQRGGHVQSRRGQRAGIGAGGAVVLLRRRQPGVLVHRRLARGDDQLPVEPEQLDRPGQRLIDGPGRSGRRDDSGLGLGRFPDCRPLPGSGPGAGDRACRQPDQGSWVRRLRPEPAAGPDPAGAARRRRRSVRVSE